MSTSTFNNSIGVFWECSDPTCHFRYPETEIKFDTAYCPKCGEPAVIKSQIISSHMKNRRSDPKHNRISVLLDNLRSAYNVGSIFRTCECLGLNELFLCGITPRPSNLGIKKTSLGSDSGISWIYENNSIDVLNKYIVEKYQIIGLECLETSIPIQEIQRNDLREPICLILGNERLGIDPGVQNLCDMLVGIPMQGDKESLNVSVAFAIAAFYFSEKLSAG